MSKVSVSNSPSRRKCHSVNNMVNHTVLYHVILHLGPICMAGNYTEMQTKFFMNTNSEHYMNMTG